MDVEKGRNVELAWVGYFVLVTFNMLDGKGGMKSQILADCLNNIPTWTKGIVWENGEICRHGELYISYDGQVVAPDGDEW